MQDYVKKLANHEIIPPIAKFIGFETVKCETGYSEFKMVVGKQHHNPMGTVHGGILTDISDAAMGMAFASTLIEGEIFTTINLQINFLKAIVEGPIVAKATVYKKGKSIGFVECKVYNETEDLISTSTSVCKIMKIQK